MRFKHFLALAFLALAAGGPAAAAERAIIATTMGDITVELDRERAPLTVENFVDYVKDGYYDGTIFHRVIDGFMIQGGGFTPDFEKKPTRAPVRNEADNGLANDTGTIAMARTSDPHSATAQFFINVEDNDFLNHRGKTPREWGYAVFGRVVDGMDVVNAIAKVPTGRHGRFNDVPEETVTITDVRLVEGEGKDVDR